MPFAFESGAPLAVEIVDVLSAQGCVSCILLLYRSDEEGIVKPWTDIGFHVIPHGRYMALLCTSGRGDCAKNRAKHYGRPHGMRFQMRALHQSRHPDQTPWSVIRGVAVEAIFDHATLRNNKTNYTCLFF